MVSLNSIKKQPTHPGAGCKDQPKAAYRAGAVLAGLAGAAFAAEFAAGTAFDGATFALDAGDGEVPPRVFAG